MVRRVGQENGEVDIWFECVFGFVGFIGFVGEFVECDSGFCEV